MKKHDDKEKHSVDEEFLGKTLQFSRASFFCPKKMKSHKHNMRAQWLLSSESENKAKRNSSITRFRRRCFQLFESTR